jgi:hypothetical protein
MKDLSRYNVAFAICPELKQEIENNPYPENPEDVYKALRRYAVTEPHSIILPAKEDKIVDTTQLQIASLLMFAAQHHWTIKPDFSFKRVSRSVSFEDMVKFHNSSDIGYKLVKKVKLQRVKRTKKLVAQSMMVELV